MSEFVIDVVILLGVGLILFYVIANLIDATVYRLTVGPGDPTEILLGGFRPNPRQRFVLNIVRPVILTVIIFGGGLLTVAILGLSTWGAFGAGCWFLYLNGSACLVGRRPSLNEAGWAMVVTTILLVCVFIAVQSGQ